MTIPIHRSPIGGWRTQNLATTNSSTLALKPVKDTPAERRSGGGRGKGEEERGRGRGRGEVGVGEVAAHPPSITLGLRKV